VLAAAVALDTKAAVAANGKNLVRIASEGYPEFSVDLTDVSPRAEEKGTSASLVRGIAASFAKRGFQPVGFDATVSSDLIAGGGLSSSASFEVLIGTIMNHLTGAGLSPLEIARIGQFAENEYYGKPCGLMDQTACACGGVLAIDFTDTSAPAVTQLDVNFEQFGYSLCIVDTGADHSGLTDEYAAIPAELKHICSYFGKKFLREVPEEEFYARFASLSDLCGDRAMLRAIHVYNENRRVKEELAALKEGDFEKYLRAVRASGASSWQYLQNVIPAGSSVHQEMAVTLALIDHLLEGKGACRLQGGGFAGTVQAYVPVDEVDTFITKMEGFLGKGKVTVVSIRREGGTLV